MKPIEKIDEQEETKVVNTMSQFNKMGMKINSQMSLKGKSQNFVKNIGVLQKIQRTRTLVDLLKVDKVIDFDQFKHDLENINSQELDCHKQYTSQADSIKKSANLATITFSIKPKKENKKYNDELCRDGSRSRIHRQMDLSGSSQVSDCYQTPLMRSSKQNYSIYRKLALQLDCNRGKNGTTGQGTNRQMQEGSKQQVSSFSRSQSFTKIGVKTPLDIHKGSMKQLDTGQNTQSRKSIGSQQVYIRKSRKVVVNEQQQQQNDVKQIIKTDQRDNRKRTFVRKRYKNNKYQHQDSLFNNYNNLVEVDNDDGRQRTKKYDRVDKSKIKKNNKKTIVMKQIEDINVMQRNKQAAMKRMDSVQSGISFICGDQGLSQRQKIFSYVKGTDFDCLKTTMNNQIMRNLYESSIRREKRLQNRMLKDELVLMMDKIQIIKNLFTNRYKLYEVFGLLELKRQIDYNRKLEKVIFNLNWISQLLLQEYRNNQKDIGIGKNPIEEEQHMTIDNEKQGFLENIILFNKMSEYMKDCIDCYEIIEGMKDRKKMGQEDVEMVIQMISQSRYLLGELYELYKIYDHKSENQRQNVLFYTQSLNEKDFDPDSIVANRKSKLSDLPYFRNRDQMIQIINDEIEDKERRNKKEVSGRLKRKKLLNDLMEQKFKTGKKQGQTRESKMILNQDKFDEKKKLILDHERIQNQQKIGKVKIGKINNPHPFPVLSKLANKFNIRID